MAQQQLCSLELLRASGFGRPFPRHGLQLLFWFANDCVTVELQNIVDVMKLVSDCQPEKGAYGFHPFGNIEELLPILKKSKKKSKKAKNKTQFLYFEVGNLNTRNYPASADLPAYVRENHRKESNCNTDRIIISYQKSLRVVETVYVTEHNDADFGRFRADRTHEISSELIRALQNPQLDISTFLLQMDYCEDVHVLRDTDNMYNLDPSSQLMFDMMRNDPVGFFSEAFSHQLDLNLDPFSYNMEVHGGGPVVHCNFDEEYKKRRGGGGFSLWKILFATGAIYVAVKALRWWLRSSWDQDFDENLVWIPRKTPTYPRTHVMLDYVY
ncbi:uncharacterized protein FYW49_008020 [Xenentodon cancila]